MENKTKEQIDNIQRAKDVISQLSTDLLRDDIVLDNKFEFEVKEKTYRVRLPNNKEKRDADRYKHKEYIKLLKDPDYITRNKLIELHKESGLDINKIDDEIQVLNDQIQGIYENIAKTSSENEKALDNLEGKVQDRIVKIQKLSIEKAEALAFCLEEELYARYLEYLVLICTEKLIDPEQTGEDYTWKKVWNNQEEFDTDSNIELAELSTLYLSKLFGMMRRY